MSLVEFPFMPASRQPVSSSRLIGIVLFERFSLLQVAEIADVFEKANQTDAARAAPRYKTIFLSPSSDHVYSLQHVAVLTQKLAGQGAALPDLRALFAADSEGVIHSSQEQPLAVLTRRAHRSPKETSSASAIQAALEIVQRDLGADAAREIAALLPWTSLPRPVSVAVDSCEPVSRKIRDSAQWIARNCDKRISITIAAQHAGMSERSYLRHFRAEMGVKPSEHLRRVRVALASTLLAESDLPVDKIARRCGMASGECLTRLFRQIANQSPTEYRSRMRREPA